MNTYQIVTDRIVAMLEAGAAPWSRPWKTGADGATISGFQRPLRINGAPYRGVNTINLWAAGQAAGYRSAYWMTYKAAREYGAFVRKGERAEMAFYVGRSTKVTTDDAGTESEESFSFLKTYAVFNADQIDDLPAKFYAPMAPAPIAADGRIAEVDAFARASGAVIRHGGDKAFFSPFHDIVQMPAFGAFAEPIGYYSTLLHELTHWTSMPARCARSLSGRFGDEAYAAEELIAELGAAFLCADLGLCSEPRADHASYIASWIKVLKNDNRAIFRAATLAEKAAGYLHGLADAAEPVDAPAEPVDAPAEPIAAPAEPVDAPAEPIAAPAAAKGKTITEIWNAARNADSRYRAMPTLNSAEVAYYAAMDQLYARLAADAPRDTIAHYLRKGWRPKLDWFAPAAPVDAPAEPIAAPVDVAPIAAPAEPIAAPVDVAPIAAPAEPIAAPVDGATFIRAGYGFNVGYDFARLRVDTPIELAPNEFARPGEFIGYIAGDPTSSLGFLRAPRVRVLITRAALGRVVAPAEPIAAPVDAPAEPVDVAPIAAPVDAPAEPVDAPAEPVDAPAEPVEAKAARREFLAKRRANLPGYRKAQDPCGAVPRRPVEHVARDYREWIARRDGTDSPIVPAWGVACSRVDLWHAAHQAGRPLHECAALGNPIGRADAALNDAAAQLDPAAFGLFLDAREATREADRAAARAAARQRDAAVRDRLAA
jgi:antirestriction protein ArdC